MGKLISARIKTSHPVLITHAEVICQALHDAISKTIPQGVGLINVTLDAATFCMVNGQSHGAIIEISSTPSTELQQIIRHMVFKFMSVLASAKDQCVEQVKEGFVETSYTAASHVQKQATKITDTQNEALTKLGLRNKSFLSMVDDNRNFYTACFNFVDEEGLMKQ